MPVYHFNVHDDVSGTSPDWTGTELSDMGAAKREAVRFAGATIAENVVLQRHGDDWHLEVTDHAGAPLFHLDFVMRPALSDSPSHEPLTSAVHRHAVGAQ